VTSSILAYPEGRAALASARRAERLTQTGYRAALEDFETTHSELLVVAIDDPLARHAGELAEGLGLRGYDAVHLASSLALGPDTMVITWDLDLNRAAHDSGLAVAPAP
jgi:predicted nucleic acid-binding protein